MSRQITIPAGINPFTVSINGVTTYYAAGATVTVDDATALVIEQWIAQKTPDTPVYPTAGTVLTAGQNGAKSFEALPTATTEKAGIAKMVENQADSTATTIAALKEDLNDLLDAMKTAGVMEPDEE